MSETQQQLIMRLALNSQHREGVKVTAQDEAEWQQFIRGEKVVDTQRMMQLMDGDPDKFAQWLASRPAGQKKPWWYIDISVWQTQWLIPTAFASMLLISLTIFWQMDTEQQWLQHSFATVVSIAPVNAPPFSLQALPSTQAEKFGFSGSGQSKQNIASFLYGMDLAKARILHNHLQVNPPTQAIDEVWQQFGQWYQLNRFVTDRKSPLDAAYWSLQKRLLNYFQDQLTLTPSLGGMLKAVEKLQQKPDNKRYLRTLKAQLAVYWKALQVTANAN